MDRGRSTWVVKTGPFLTAYQPDTKTFKITAQEGYPAFEQAMYCLLLQEAGGEVRYAFLPSGEPRAASTDLGAGYSAYELDLTGESKTGLDGVLQLAWQDDGARMLWRLEIHNHASAAVALNCLLFDIGRVEVSPPSHPSADLRARSEEELLYFHHGWQSWSHAGWLPLTADVPTTRLGVFTRPMQLAQGFPVIPGARVSDMFTLVIHRNTRNGFLAGFLTQKMAFGQILLQPGSSGLRLQFAAAMDGVELRPGDRFQSDWCSLEPIRGSSLEPERGFLQTAGILNHARTAADLPVGWCTWYYYYGKVRQEDVVENTTWISENLDRLPLQLVQVDDGFQAKIGDWYDRADSFPDDMKLVADFIHAHDLRAGIWLAPFLVHPGSRVSREHPEWILRNAAGKPVTAGWGWNSFPRVLDITHPEVLLHLERLIRTVTHEWGFRYLKLDFLCAGAIPGHYHDSSKPRAAAFVRALQTIRDAAGDEVTLVGCGCPLGPAIGIFDAMRIGPDVAPAWQPRLGLISKWIEDDPGLPAARNAIRNTLARVGQHRRWWINDPDCLLLREDDSRLSPVETKTLATAIALSGGALILSDRLSALGDLRVAWAGKLLPPLQTEGHLASWWESEGLTTLVLELQGTTGSWFLIGIFNLGEHELVWALDRSRLRVEEHAALHCLEFWAARYARIEAHEHLQLEIEPHGSRCLSLRKDRPGPQWVGSDIHISQGAEVHNWVVGDGRLSFELGFPNRRMDGSFWLELPGAVTGSWVNGDRLQPDSIHQSIVRYNVRLDGSTKVDIQWRESRA
jgi:alpha-galactosidase